MNAAKPRFLETTSAAARGSLRRALLVWLIVPLFLLVPLAAALMYRMTVRPALDGLDRGLTATALALSRILVTRDGTVSLPLSEQTRRALKADSVDEVIIAVGNGHAELLAGDAGLLALRPNVGEGQWLFFDTSLRGRAMRAAAFGARCGGYGQVCPVLVAESLIKRRDARRAVITASLVAALLLALALTLLALVAVRRGLRPLQQASADISSRSLQRLDPISLDGVPREAAAFVTAVNALLDRLRAAAAAQRAFVEDAAHQLRTPLTTLLVESSQALSQPHPPELSPSLERLHAAAERGARLARQLLTLARTDGAALHAGASRQNVDLARLAANAADDWLGPSLDAGQDLGFELQPANVLGDELMLNELLGNLVHNAIQYAGKGAKVTVRTRTAGDQAVLEVIDDGLGIDADDLAEVWVRFRRGRNATGLGTGLGLSIVQDIAHIHGGSAHLEPSANGRGLVARVTLPSAPPASANLSKSCRK
jgi:two-component system sensor histidine kinase TctE